MTVIAETTLEGWNQLLETFGERSTFRLYRGESDADRPSLASTFHRTMIYRDPPYYPRGDRILAVERMALAHFQRQAPLLLPSALANRLRSRIDWWTVMQHYRAPTRLLDWSKSAFVATYFAVNDDEKKDGLVWSVDVDIVQDALLRIFREEGITEPPVTPEEIEPLIDQFSDRKLLLFPEPSILTDRMVA